MNPTKIVAAMLCAAMLWTSGALADRFDPCDPRYHPITPPDCTAAGRAGKHLGEMRQAIAEENVAIAAARKRFWETYPDKPGAAEARDEFGKRLDGKDSYYLWVTLTDALGGVKSVDTVGGKLDGGIPRYASFEFRDWVEAIKFNLGEKSLTDALLKNPLALEERLVKAMAASEKKRDIYLFERDWGEFDAVGREPAGLDDPAMYFPALCVRGQKISWEDALAEFDGIVKALGKDNVLRAIQQVHAAPRERFGVLKVTMPPPVKRGPGGSEVEDDNVPLPEGVIGVTAFGIRAVERLATQGDDRRYLLWLLADQNRRGSDIVYATKWQYAETAYQRLVIAFGEQDVLQASRLVRTATKRATSGDVMDSKAIGATRGVPFSSFQDILARKNPRGYLRAALLFSENLDSPAALDAAYKKLVSTGDENVYLEAARKMAAGRPNLLNRGELEDIKGTLTAPPVPERPAVTLVDYPEYLGWKKFAPGAKVSYARRNWQPAGPGSDRLVAGPVNYLRTFQLQSINAEQAKLWFGETFFDQSGKAKPPHEREEYYPAKYAPPTVAAATPLAPNSNLAIGAEATSAPTESGEEAIEINGKRIATLWQSKSYRYNASFREDHCSLIVKVWTSDAVPTGLVRKTEDKTCPAVQNRPATRFMIETYLDSFEGFMPVASK